MILFILGWILCGVATGRILAWLYDGIDGVQLAMAVTFGAFGLLLILLLVGIAWTADKLEGITLWRNK